MGTYASLSLLNSLVFSIELRIGVKAVTARQLRRVFSHKSSGVYILGTSWVYLHANYYNMYFNPKIALIVCYFTQKQKNRPTELKIWTDTDYFIIPGKNVLDKLKWSKYNFNSYTYYEYYRDIIYIRFSVVLSHVWTVFDRRTSEPNPFHLWPTLQKQGVW